MNEREQGRRRWFQLKLSDLLLGVTLVATGLGGFAALNGAFDIFFGDGWFKDNWEFLTREGALFASCALIGAGIMSPFRLKTLGLILGFVLSIPVMYLLVRFFP